MSRYLVFFWIFAAFVFAAILLGLKLVVVGEGQVGIQLRGGSPLSESLPPGFYVSVPGWRQVVVLEGAQIRISVLKLRALHGKDHGVQRSIRLLWVVHSPEAVKFYLAVRDGGATHQYAEQTLIMPSIESLIRHLPPEEWAGIGGPLNQALKPFAIRVLQIEVLVA